MDVERGGGMGKKKKEKEKEEQPLRIFGRPIAEAGQYSSDETVPQVVLDTTSFINQYGLHSEGIFRECGSVKRVNELRKKYENLEHVEFEDGKEINTIASLLKIYLSMVPGGIGGEERKVLQSIPGDLRPEEQADRARRSLLRLGRHERETLYYITQTCALVISCKDVNKMSLLNLGISLGFGKMLDACLACYQYHLWPRINVFYAPLIQSALSSDPEGIVPVVLAESLANVPPGLVSTQFHPLTVETVISQYTKGIFGGCRGLDGADAFAVCLEYLRNCEDLIVLEIVLRVCAARDEFDPEDEDRLYVYHSHLLLLHPVQRKALSLLLDWIRSAWAAIDPPCTDLASLRAVAAPFAPFSFHPLAEIFIPHLDEIIMGKQLAYPKGGHRRYAMSPTIKTKPQRPPPPDDGEVNLLDVKHIVGAPPPARTKKKKPSRKAPTVEDCQ